ncbi:MAG: 2-succinylbenzoate--CoA ligase [Calothrix sp. MO_192.B10]|nr:2-succinylbenzoate--CoA ligase [Calothrix sp. MO_192.B10]
MESPLNIWKNRTNNHWLVGQDNSAFFSLVETFYEEFTQLKNSSNTQTILLVEPDSIRFFAGFLAACSVGFQIFIGNPSWREYEWEQVFNLVKPDILWGDCKYLHKYFNPQSDNKSNGEKTVKNWIMIPTGGSSGKIRFAIHSWETLSRSVEGFRNYFQLIKINSICALPHYHVSGLMQFMRSFLSGGQLLVVPFKELKSGQCCDFDPTEFFISLVPTQLQRLFDDVNITHWLSRCRTVFIGGAPTWSELFEKARYYGIRLAICYGMTETASQIATLKPEVFLAGSNSNGKILPHAEVKILNQTGEELAHNQTGTIAIKSGSLALGYYPQLFPESEYYQTDDIGFFDSQGNLNIVGRSSNKIITGGENVFSTEVESAIRSTHLVKDVAVIGLPDKYWGQIITAIYVPCYPKISSQEIKNALDDKLSRFKHPKFWVPVEILPSNNQGKVNREQLYQIATRHQICS